MILNVLDFPDLPSTGLDRVSAALTAANSGDRIYLPARVPYQAPPGGWIVTKGVEIFGDGPGPCDETAQYRNGTILVPHSDSIGDHVFVLVPPEPPPGVANNDRARLEGVYIHDLAIMSRSAARGGGDGIRFVSVDTPISPDYPLGVKHKLTVFSASRIAIRNLGGSGFRLVGADGGFGAVNNVLMDMCDVAGCGSAGIVIREGYAVAMTSVRSVSNVSGAVSGDIGEIAMMGCSFEGAGIAPAYACVRLDRFSQVLIEACRFTAFGKPPTTIPEAGRALALLDVKGSATVVGCAFELSAPNQFATGIAIENTLQHTGPVLVLPNRFVNVGPAVLVTGESHGVSVMPQFGSPLTIGGNDAAYVTLPPATSVDNAAFGVPNVNNGTTNRIGALAIPILAANPTLQLTSGHTAYVVSSGTPGVDALRMFVGGAWHDVSLS